MKARRKHQWLGLIGGAAILGASLTGVNDAQACGCFTPPDPSVPVVQAGERIVFAIADGQVTAHIQIQYSGTGDGADFGWILPLPAVPTLELGTDELFNQLIGTTQPKYRLNRVYEGNCSFDPSRGVSGGGVASAPSAGAGDGGGGTVNPSPLVIQDSIGPYDYAVLRADSKDEMLTWLTDNHYFVPAGTDETVAPYIRPGAFFLALKLHSGNSAGDLQPVVVKYASDLPMIPLVLTSVGAQPDMGIQVWMLGAGRAIPRNYYHTVINDALIDWNTAGANYNDVIIAATKEAEGRHTFVTEYAGSSSVMQKVLNPTGRFGSTDDLAKQPDVLSFVSYLNQHGYVSGSSNGGSNYSSQLVAILGKYIPLPPGLAQQGLSLSQFYLNIEYYLGSYQQQRPSDFEGWTTNYVPDQIAAEIQERVVTPTLAAGALFDSFSYLTRLYTTLSPEQMNKDPVFSYNASLPEWPNVHEATLTYHCGYFGASNASTTPATLKTDQGWSINYPYGTGNDFSPPTGLPASEKIEVLAEEGAPQIVVDNTKPIGSTLGERNGNGCDVSARERESALGGLGGLFGLFGALFLARRRRLAA